MTDLDMPSIHHAVALQPALWLRAADAANDLDAKLRNVYNYEVGVSAESLTPKQIKAWGALFTKLDQLAHAINQIYTLHNKNT